MAFFSKNASEASEWKYMEIHADDDPSRDENLNLNDAEYKNVRYVLWNVNYQLQYTDRAF